MEASMTNRTPVLFLMLLLLVLALAVVLAASTLPALNLHAVQRHSQASLQAWEYINTLDNADHCKWSCPDGRDRYVCSMPGGKWAVAVVEAGRMITAFITDQDYAKSVIDKPGCSNPYHYSHP